MIASSFRGAQLVEPIVRDIPQPQPVSTVYVDPAYRVRPYLTCAKGYTQFWGTLGTWKYQPIDDSLFSKKVKSISPEESNRLPCLPVDSLDHDDGAGVFDFVEALIDCLSFCWFGAPTEKPRPQLTEEELEWSPFAWAPLTDGEIERGVVADWSPAQCAKQAQRYGVGTRFCPSQSGIGALTRSVRLCRGRFCIGTMLCRNHFLHIDRKYSVCFRRLRGWKR